jgi:hypothetical protein
MQSITPTRSASEAATRSSARPRRNPRCRFERRTDRPAASVHPLPARGVPYVYRIFAGAARVGDCNVWAGARLEHAPAAKPGAVDAVRPFARSRSRIAVAATSNSPHSALRFFRILVAYPTSTGMLFLRPTRCRTQCTPWFSILCYFRWPTLHQRSSCPVQLRHCGISFASRDRSFHSQRHERHAE